METFAVDQLSTDDRQIIRQSLLDYRKDGVENPLLPLNVDLDGDGIVDAWGLDENDEVVLVSGRAIDDTVFFSSDEESGSDNDDLSDVELDDATPPEGG